MNALSILYLVGIALLITLFFSFVLRVRGPWGSFWTFFIILLFALLTADAWIQPIGPYFADVYWLPPLAVGLLIAFILAAAAPSPRTRSKIEQQQKMARDDGGSVALGIFFWFLLVFMLALVIIGYIYGI